MNPQSQDVNTTGKSIAEEKVSKTTEEMQRQGNLPLSSFAGIPLKQTKEDILGHSKVEQTLKYIKVSAEENAKRLQNHPYFTGR